MIICENGVYRNLTPSELTAMEAEAARYAAQERTRPLTEQEVTAMLIRQQVNTLEVDDSTALRMISYYPEWKSNKAYTAENGCPVGYKVTQGGKLYKLRQEHTSQDNWAPDATGTESLWTRIDETHDGTRYDPVPAARGMEYVYGLYYLDSEDGKLYLCQRTGEAAGGTVVLQYLPHELVGNYFAEVIN